MADLYENDVVTWSEQQAALLRLCDPFEDYLIVFLGRLLVMDRGGAQPCH